MRQFADEKGSWFVQFVQGLPAPAWAKDVEGRYIYVNPAAAQAFGRAAEEMLGRTDDEIFPSDIAKAFKKNDKLAMENANHLQEVEVFGDKDGIPRYSLVTKFALRGADGTICLAGTAVDITEQRTVYSEPTGSELETSDRKVAEEKLRESLDRNQSVIDSIASLIAVLDADGNITLVNRAWIQFAKDNGAKSSLDGLGPGVNYLRVCENVSGEDRADALGVRDGITAILSGEIDSYSLEYPCHSPNSQRFFLLTVTPLIGGGAVISYQDITDRRTTEDEIRNVVERLSLAQKAGNVGIWDWNASTDETYWSDQMWEFYGGRPEGAVPTTSFWEEHLYEPDRARVLGSIRDRLAERVSTYRDDFRIVRHDGEIRWIESSATIERNADGSPRRMYGVNLDITDRKSIEERIRSSESQLRLITDSLPALVSYIGSDRTYKVVNRRYTDWFGEPADAIVGRQMIDVLGDAALESLEPYIRKVLAGETASFETWVAYKGAGRRYVHVAYVPDVLPDGRVAGFYALVSDFTEHRRSEELLRMSEDRVRILTDSFTDYAILSVDRNGVIDGWNPGAVNIFGYSEAEIIGRPVDELFTPEDRDQNVPQQELEKAAEFGRASDERWHLRKDGSRFYASGVMAPLYIGGELTGYAKIASDLTEKRRQSEELQRAYEEMEIRVRERTKELASANESLLEEINERRSAERQRITLLQKIVTTQEDERRRIARDLHDQLGQRLTALRLKLKSLGDLCLSDRDMYPRVQRIQQIAELLDSEVSFLAWQLRPTALDELGLVAALETFVSEWSRHYNKSAEFHNTRVSDLRLDTEVETQVYRITQEALNNVVKHAEAQRVSVILERIGQAIVLIIEDDGVGFDEGSVPKRFEGPPGLGLAGMRERADLIGGELEIESERGRGTTIYVRVPMKDIQAGLLTP